MNPDEQAGNRELEQNIKEVMRDLPPPIRSYLSSGRYSMVAKELMSKYGLHIDQGGILEREIMLLVMGLESPQAFLEALEHEAGIPDDVARNLTTDINEQIFIPLRDEMRHTNTRSPLPPPRPRVQAPPPSYGAPRPAPPRPVPPPPPPQAFIPPPPPRAEPSIVLSPMPPAQVRPAQPPQLGRSDLPNSAPLPPRTVLPGASAPVFHNPMPTPLGQRSEPPPNLPTGLPEPESTPLPPVARPGGSPRFVPPPPSSGDPYREPPE